MLFFQTTATAIVKARSSHDILNGANEDDINTRRRLSAIHDTSDARSIDSGGRHDEHNTPTVARTAAVVATTGTTNGPMTASYSSGASAHHFGTYAQHRQHQAATSTLVKAATLSARFHCRIDTIFDGQHVQIC